MVERVRQIARRMLSHSSLDRSRTRSPRPALIRNWPRSLVVCLDYGSPFIDVRQAGALSSP